MINYNEALNVVPFLEYRHSDFFKYSFKDGHVYYGMQVVKDELIKDLFLIDVELAKMKINGVEITQRLVCDLIERFIID